MVARVGSYSIKTLLGLIVGGTGLLLLVVTGASLFQSWQEWRSGERVVSLTAADRQVLQTLLGARMERALFLSAVASADPVSAETRGRITSFRMMSENAYPAALAHLSDLDVPGLAEVAGRMKAAHEAMASLRDDVDAAIARPVGDRPPALSRSVAGTVTAYTDSLAALDEAVHSAAKLVDPAIDQLLVVKRAAWIFRNLTGAINTRIETAVFGGREWSATDSIANASDAGRQAYAWAEIKEFAASSVAAGRIAEAYSRIKDLYEGGASDDRRRLVAALDAHEPFKGSKEALQKSFVDEVMAPVALVDAVLDEMVRRAESRTSHARVLLVVYAALAVAAIALNVSGFLIVVRHISSALVEITKVVERMANHDLEAAIPNLDRGDEIGVIARAMEVFRGNARRAAELEAERDKDRRERDVHARSIETLAAEFDRDAAQTVKAVLTGTAELDATANAMLADSERTSERASAVASAFQGTSANVQNLASAAEELSASISEIRRQVEQSAKISRDASNEASRASETVNGLATYASRIGDVVELIAQIAGRTNLLALNATIESARAGDMGKGFAVVAGEVKGLANQTAAATQEITGQVEAVQSATDAVVQVIGGIVGHIGDVSLIAESIASSIERQAEATNNIALNVQNVAAGARDVSANVEGVAALAAETRRAADRVLVSATMMSREATRMGEQISSFSAKIRQ